MVLLSCISINRLLAIFETQKKALYRIRHYRGRRFSYDDLFNSFSYKDFGEANFRLQNGAGNNPPPVT